MFYDYASSSTVASLPVFQKSPCLCAEYHPLLVSTVAISNWEGRIAILKCVCLLKQLRAFITDGWNKATETQLFYMVK